ncbi:CPCC family cysteine-rich protein [Micromonospora profundi]|uniref:CPCC family cysteine-rich protein n=1 Tax=Micromonospora profundi TaxID=1420889 RepID=UPI00143B3E54
MTRKAYRSPCPCCGHLVHDDRPGSSLICPVCFWEDDQVQLRWPFYRGGANKVSLVEAQRNYGNLGVSETRFADKVRSPSRDEALDRGFRPIDISVDSFEETSVQEESWPEDRSVLYWWRPTFWRRPKGEV